MKTRLIILAACVIGPAVSASPRERISINDNWRFHLGDPDGNSAGLSYDVRPEVKDVKDDKAADTMPTEAEKIASPAQPVLKAWILPTGNAFIKDPSKHHVRPAGDPGGDHPHVRAGFDDSSWESVSLPHDWAIKGPFHIGEGDGPGGGMGRLPSHGIGWYRKSLDIPQSDAGKSIFLEVDGAMSYASVWLNGKLAGGWPYGYSSWRVDLTPHVIPGGDNRLAIRLDNPPNSSRWYPGGGIYRNVWLTKTQPLHVGQWGTFLTTREVSSTAATIDLEVTLANDTRSDATVHVSTEIFALDTDGAITGAAVGGIGPREISVTSAPSAKVKGSVTLTAPRLWGPPPSQIPNRYVAVTTVSHQGKPVDRYETRFGIRELVFDPDKGLLVNGERIAIRGVNQHHDLGALGAAFNMRAAQRQLEMLRELGCNAIRMAHNPPAPELLDLTDQMGFLVINESFDSWERKKTPLDFHLIFPDWHEQDMRALIRRDRNHPSVILWSIGNEVGEQYTGDAGAEVAKRLHDIAHDEDPTRLTTVAMNWAKPDMPMPSVVDVISLNYQGEGIRDTPAHASKGGILTPPQYAAFRAKFPGKVIVSSESAAALSTRGEYGFPVHDGISAAARDGQGGDSKNQFVSSYELYAAEFGSSPDKVFAAQDRNPYVAGEFVWSGWDYLGEPTPFYSARSSNFGIIDLAGFKKDRFYLYQSRWRSDLPVAHILPHWNWPDRVGLVTPVHVFTSGDEAELFLNGRSLGKKKKGGFEYRLRWDDVLYEPGELKVVASKDGQPWATGITRTTDAPARLEIAADRSVIRSDGLDLSFVTVRVTDKNGLTCPRAKNPIRFSIDGPGEIVATDNGDPTSFESFQAPQRKAFNGLCLVIVRATPGKPGTIRLKAESDSLQAASISLQGTAEIHSSR